MDELAHRTVAKIWGSSEARGPRHSPQAMLANYMQRRQTGQWADLMGRHTIEEMSSYVEAMENLARKMGGV